MDELLPPITLRPYQPKRYWNPYRHQWVNTLEESYAKCPCGHIDAYHWRDWGDFSLGPCRWASGCDCKGVIDMLVES